jgi:hypothetical protein
MRTLIVAVGLSLIGFSSASVDAQVAVGAALGQSDQAARAIRLILVLRSAAQAWRASA